MNNNKITVIERYERGYVSGYSVDGGKTFHISPNAAVFHMAEKLKTQKPSAQVSEQKTSRKLRPKAKS